MKYRVHQTVIRTLRSGDDNFLLKDGIVVTPRAALEISNHCPENYKYLLQECIGHGWIKPVAQVYDHEITFDILKKG